MINDERVINLAKWHENEAVRIRKHPDADMASAHGLAEIHGETASTLYMLLAEHDAAIMDADMQAREAGNMEYNVRVLMAERDRLREALRDIETPSIDIVCLGAWEAFEWMMERAATALKENNSD